MRQRVKRSALSRVENACLRKKYRSECDEQKNYLEMLFVTYDKTQNVSYFDTPNLNYDKNLPKR